MLRSPVCFVALGLALGCSAPPVASDAASAGDGGGVDARRLDAATDAPLPACTTAVDCPAPGDCHAAASCEAGRCAYAALAPGTACGSDRCAPGSCDDTGACVAAPVVCNDPPESSDLAGCVPGSTIHVPLGGACGGSCDPATGECTYAMVEVPCPPAVTTLAQHAGYAVVLRESMSHLAAADFEVTPAPITFADTGDDDATYRLWSAVVRPGGEVPGLPSYAAVNVDASAFTLAAVEAGGGLPHAYVGDNAPVTFGAAFYATWDDPGNPYFGDAALMRRAFYTAAADLITMQDCTARDACMRGAMSSQVVNRDNFNGAFREYAHIAYLAHQSSLIPACDLAAYDVGLRRLFDWWEGEGYASGNADMIMATLPAVHYAAEALGDPALRARAIAKAADVMARNCDEAGFCNHQNGSYDASYEGFSAVHIAEAALVTRDPDLVRWTERFALLRGYTTLPEPDGSLVGPSHFSPATSRPAAYDQVSLYVRDTAVAQLTDEGLFFLHAGEQPFPSPAEMRAFLGMPARMAEANQFARNVGNDTMWDWSYRHYPRQSSPGFVSFAPGTYARFRDAAGTDMALPPMRRAADFARTFGSELVSARAGGLGMIVHFGGIDDGDVGSGFGGGALSALWTEQTGAVLLGWNRGSQAFEDRTITVASCSDARCRASTCAGTTCVERVDTTFTWADLYGWPTHAISGRAGGASFSSARIVDPSETITSAGGVTTITTTGDVNGGMAEDGAALAGAFVVSRTFQLAPGTAGTGELTLTTEIDSSGNAADEIFEVLPVFLGQGSSAAGTVVRLRQSSGTIVDATATETTSVVAIRIERFGATIEIALDTPHGVRLSPADTTSTYMWQPRGRNVLVRLHAGGAVPGRLTLTETFRALP